MKFPLQAVAILLAAFTVESCSEKSSADRRTTTSKEEREHGEEQQQPDQDQIVEDCIGFVHSTKLAPAPGANANCPTCPPDGTDVFTFRGMKTENVSCTNDRCTVVASIRAVFNPGAGEKIVGGLTAWIPPEQRSAYLGGQAPAGEQTFRVQLTYKKSGERWRAIEFDRAAK